MLSSGLPTLMPSNRYCASSVAAQSPQQNQQRRMVLPEIACFFTTVFPPYTRPATTIGSNSVGGASTSHNRDSFSVSFSSCTKAPRKSRERHTILKKKQHVVKKCNDRSGNSKLLSEAIILAGLCTPHVSQIMRVGQKDKLVFIEVEAGTRDLDQIIHEDERLSDEQFWCYALDIALAISEIHLRGVIHLDIKPKNIVEINGFLKVIDFGQSLKEPFTIDQNDVDSYGEGAYLAPEFNRTIPNYAWDIFSFGVTCLEMASRAKINTPGLRDFILAAQTESQLFSGFPDAAKRPAEIQHFIWNLIQQDPSKRATLPQILATRDIDKRRVARASLAVKHHIARPSFSHFQQQIEACKQAISP